MIVLRITVGNETEEFRSDRAHVLLGAGAAATLRRRDAGWRDREAALLHADTHVLLSRPGRPGAAVAVRVGDVVHLGRAKVALVGLLPRAAPLPAAASAPGGVVFGGYEDAPSVAGAPGTTSAADAAALERAFAGHDTFGETLYTAVRKSPFYAISLALHALVILGIVVTKPATPPKPEERRELVTLERPRPSDETILLGPSPPPLSIPEIPEIEIPQEVPPSTTMPETRETVPTLGPLQGEDDAAPFDIGLTPTLSAIGARTPRRRAPAAKVDLAESFTESEAAAATDRAAGFVRDQIGSGSEGQGHALSRVAKTDLLVVRGGFDHVGRVLDALKLPYTLVQPHHLAQATVPDLRQHKVIFWNCGEASPKEQERLIARRVRQFVENGGYLFSTDWAIQNLVIPAFPGYLASSGRDNPMPEVVVEIVPDAAHADDPLLDGVFRRGVTGRWWLEQASYDMKIVKTGEVQVLVRSPELDSRFHRGDAVAATFHHGRGRVLHVMGHYFQKQGDIAGTVAAQRLALNFVLQRLTQD